jgi:hypothetical protein
VRQHTDLDWAPNDATLVSAATDGSACVWQTASLLEGLPTVRRQLEFSPGDYAALQQLMDQHHMGVECEQYVPFVLSLFICLSLSSLPS